ncbi:Lipase [Bathymodiolus thermophilus thioautotrophic gill symbiont]|uniref:lipase family protein n=1 Tax=Bathymodiolus thermophilus thioautotrophic gill symbiont TaxID=2360 RepID=UPI0010B54458|nr:lipase family protein [Bathymodiolus thermophilus thioautotrophic gill symbiont]SGZ76944.1 Lipase [Bathymodiolus thermophilus thioautotrophic gill symbiont]
MTSSKKFDINLALELAHLSAATYTQYVDYIKGKKWTVPEGYKLEITFQTTHEGDPYPLGFIASKGGDIYISWRGVLTIEEWFEAIDFEQEDCAYLTEGSKVESGFYQVYTLAEKICSPQVKVLNFLKERQIKGNIYLTGHSLGGALAVLNVLDIVKHTKYQDLILYSFAAPRTGSPEYAAIYNNANLNSWRVVNVNDEVPKLPLKNTLGCYYQHVNQEFSITFGSGCIEDWAEDHLLPNYISQLEKMKEGLCANTNEE